jgi:hypothetical protein
VQEAAAILRVPVQQLSPDDVVQLGSRLLVCTATYVVLYPFCGCWPMDVCTTFVVLPKTAQRQQLRGPCLPFTTIRLMCCRVTRQEARRHTTSRTVASGPTQGGSPARRPSTFTPPSAYLQEFEARRGVASRLAGALSFVNLMWGGAIVGLTISVGPVVAIVCQPAFAVRAQAVLTAARCCLHNGPVPSHTAVPFEKQPCA